MPIRILNQPVHFSPEDSTSPALGGRSAATGQPYSPGNGEATPSQPTVETPPAGTRPGFWGIFLGTLDLLVVLALGALIILLFGFLGSSGSDAVGAILTLLCAAAFPAVLGVVFGVRSLRGKKRSRLWSALYLVFVPLFFFLFILFLRRLW